MNTLLILCSVGLLSLCSEIFGFRKIFRPILFTGLVAALFFVIRDWNTNLTHFNDMVVFDNYALAFSGLIISISLAWFAISPDFFHESTSAGDHFSLIIFAMIGAMLMTSFNNMIMLFLGIEILSISMYILAGSMKTSLASNEAALKYFLMGAFSTGFLLFGMALVYGQTGTFGIRAIGDAITHHSGNHVMLYTGIFMMMSAMAFKVSAAPFHFWAPDVYQGSPTVVTAFMSTVVKTAAIAAFLKLFLTSFSGAGAAWTTSLWIMSAATILIGNITAVYQKNFKRMLAYSSISHAGYMIIAILAMNNYSASSLLFYSIAYSISSITSFAVLLAVSKATGSESIDAFNGLGKSNPFLAVVTIVAMLSLAGIPPTAGFFAKYYIFSAGIQNHLTTLVLIAVLGSLIGVFYYFRVIIALFMDKDAATVEVSTGFRAVLLLTTIVAVVLGILPGLVTGLL